MLEAVFDAFGTAEVQEEGEDVDVDDTACKDGYLRERVRDTHTYWRIVHCTYMYMNSVYIQCTTKCLYRLQTAVGNAVFSFNHMYMHIHAQM